MSEGSDSAGGYSVPDVLLAEIIDLLRARSVTLSAGASVIPIETDNTRIVKIASDPVANWRAGNDPVNESDPTFATTRRGRPQDFAWYSKLW